jgi:hypothetical protein
MESTVIDDQNTNDTATRAQRRDGSSIAVKSTGKPYPR